jgi:hypothetical protein
MAATQEDVHLGTVDQLLDEIESVMTLSKNNEKIEIYESILVQCNEQISEIKKTLKPNIFTLLMDELKDAFLNAGTGWSVEMMKIRVDQHISAINNLLCGCTYQYGDNLTTETLQETHWKKLFKLRFWTLDDNDRLLKETLKEIGYTYATAKDCNLQKPTPRDDALMTVGSYPVFYFGDLYLQWLAEYVDIVDYAICKKADESFVSHRSYKKENMEKKSLSNILREFCFTRFMDYVPMKTMRIYLTNGDYLLFRRGDGEYRSDEFEYISCKRELESEPFSDTSLPFMSGEF